MKKVFSVALCFVMIFTISSVLFVPVSANQSRASYYNMNFTLTGDPVKDMVAVAMAQNERTKGEFGYTENWCDNFIADCAIHAKQEKAVPQGGDCNDFISKVISAGGTFVSSPQAGDIAAFYSTSTNIAHVALMIDSRNCLNGNYGGSRGTPRVVKHTYSEVCSYDGRTVKFVRPAYTKTNSSTTHTHNWVFQYFWAKHPHHNEYKCSICGAIYVDYNSSNYYGSCDECVRNQYTPGKPTLTVSSTTEDNYVYLYSSTVKNADTFDYYILDLAGNVVASFMSQSSSMKTTLSAGTYSAYVAACNKTLYSKSLSPWWTSSDKVTFTVGKKVSKSISLNTYNLTLYEGESASVNVYLSHNLGITRSINNTNVISGTWGTRSTSGLTVPLTLTGKSAGSTTVTFYYTDDPDKILATLNVTVKSRTTTTKRTTTTTKRSTTTTKRTTTTTKVTQTTKVSLLYGDANSDGAVDLKDVLIIRRKLANLSVSKYNEQNADCYHDSIVNMKDVLRIRQYLAHMVSNPYCT